MRINKEIAMNIHNGFYIPLHATTTVLATLLITILVHSMDAPFFMVILTALTVLLCGHLNFLHVLKKQ